MNRIKKIEIERLNQDLDKLAKDYDDVGNKKRRESNPQEQNNLKLQLDEIVKKMEVIEQEINQLEQKEENDQRDKLIKILEDSFDEERDNILNAYKISLPNRSIDYKIPQNAAEVISNLLLPQQPEDVYNYTQKFVGYLYLLNSEISLKLKEQLKTWAEENIKNSNELNAQLRREQEQPCNPCIMIAISQSGDNYVVEAWLIKNLVEYHRNSFSDCEKLKIDNKEQIPTNKTLDDLPQLVRNLIYESSLIIKKITIKKIHIFLPLELMNHAVDSWTTDENDDETIGEMYEIFIRCSEGLRGKNSRVIAWREKGQLFKSKLAQPAADIFVVGDSKEFKTLEKQLKQTSAIGVKIIPVFQNKLPGEILWRAAVPLALWVRQELPDIENIVILDELINDCCLEQLPERVKQKRLDAMDNQLPENHVGRHLCLLWDDPDFLPPEQLLTENNL